MSLDIEPIKSRKFTVEQVDKALLVLAINGGNSIRAAGELAEQGIDVSDESLRLWRNEVYPRRYQAVHERHFAQLEDMLVAQQRELALRNSNAALAAAERLEGSIPSLDTRDLPKTVQALTTSAAIATDKLLTLTGRPTQVVQHHDYRQVLKKYGGSVIEGEAVELPTPLELPGR